MRIERVFLESAKRTIASSQRVVDRAIALAGSAKGVLSVRSKLTVLPD
jgi:hypothetical protein